jgi:hypothetical protein
VGNPLRDKHRFEDNIKMDVREIGFDDMNCISVECSDGLT